jgi:glycerol-3-phosphate responsive antiterminator
MDKISKLFIFLIMISLFLNLTEINRIGRSCDRSIKSYSENVKVLQNELKLLKYELSAIKSETKNVSIHAEAIELLLKKDRLIR